MATATADTEVRAAFRALLTAERAGYKLATALVSTLVTYLVGSVELSDVSELDLSDLLTTAEEAWAATHDGEELPNVHRQRLMRWVANVPASISVEGDTAVALSPSTGSMDEDMSKLFGDAGASTQDLARLAEDKKAQGLSGARIIRLCPSPRTWTPRRLAGRHRRCARRRCRRLRRLGPPRLLGRAPLPLRCHRRPNWTGLDRALAKRSETILRKNLIPSTI